MKPLTLLAEIPLDVRHEAFEENDLGVRFTEPSVASKLRACAKQLQLKQLVVVEGHTPGSPEENSALRRSIGEELAELCALELRRLGWQGQVQAVGCGSGLGAGLMLRLLEPQVEPRERTVQEQLQDLQSSTPLTFKSNSSDLSQEGNRFVLKCARLLRSYPGLVLQCSGFAKGRPSEDCAAKRQLSLERAQALQRALQKSGVSNPISVYGFGSALGSSGLAAALDVEAETPELPGAVSEEFRVIPHLAQVAVPEEEEADVLDALLQVLLQAYAFEPNRARIPVSPTLRMVAVVLKSFPAWILRCEGHAKGIPKDNSLVKKQLSLVRAENFRRALKELGVKNVIHCSGMGCELGIGMAVRMYALGREGALRIPQLDHLTEEERCFQLNQLLQQALDCSIDFVPNHAAIPESAADLLETVAALLRAFPSSLAVHCEAHARGLPEEDSEAKRKLTRRRAELWCQELQKRRVPQRLSASGAGCSRGTGPGLAMRAEVASDLLDERREKANQMLAQVFQDAGVKFDSNSYQVPQSCAEVVQKLVGIFEAFPDLPMRIEGHAKGQPGDTGDAKQRLSQLRAEAFKLELRKAGASNRIRCFGRGCEPGLGTSIRVAVDDEEEKLPCQPVPAQTAAPWEEQLRLQELLMQAAENGLKFQPNTTELQLSSALAVPHLAEALKAFPNFVVQCVGHTKGKVEENNDARIRLSQERAEAVRKALVAEGVNNATSCVGLGSAHGLGNRVQLLAEPEQDP